MIESHFIHTYYVYFIVAIALFNFYLFSKKNIVKCDTRKMLNNICPKADHFQSRCVENSNQPGEFDGLCQCYDGFIFNIKYTNDNDYCIIDPNTTDDPKQSNSKSGRISNNSVNSQNKNTSFVVDELKTIQTTPQPHHIVAGVLIPIVFVLIVIGSTFIYKKLHVTQRIRNIRRTHRNRPFYEDVMLGTNDIDDPPLI